MPTFTAVSCTVTKGGNNPVSTPGRSGKRDEVHLCNRASALKKEVPTHAAARMNPEDVTPRETPVTEGHMACESTSVRDPEPSHS